MSKRARKYPIYNPLAYASIATADFFLKCLLSKQNKQIKPPSKLLICNGAHLGDVILTTALLPVIKEAYKDVKIGMAVGSWSLPVIENHPLIDQIHIIDHWKQDRSRSGRYLKTRRTALKQIKAFQYDAAIDCCFHFPNFAPLLWQAHIPIRVGFKSAGLSPFLTHSLPWSPDQNVSAVHVFFSLLALFPGIRPTSLRPILPHSPKDYRKPYIVIHMGSSSEKKEWPLHKWLALTKKLLKEGYHLHFTGRGETEFHQIEEIRRYCPQIVNLCDKFNWPEFVAAIQNALLLIGVDTSAGHIAAATQTPAVLLFTGIHPPNLWRPFYTEIETITNDLPCSPCFRGCETMACIKEISVEAVYESVCKKLSPSTTCVPS